MDKKAKTKLIKSTMCGKPLARQLISTCLLFCSAALIFSVTALLYNNLSFSDTQTSLRQLDSAIAGGENWVSQHTLEILTEKNAALITMLAECSRVKANPTFDHIVKTFMQTPIWDYSQCWKKEVDPNWPFLNKRYLNKAISEEYIDNKWALYALAPDMANITPGQMRLFDPECWHGRQLTHQLFALTLLRERTGANETIDKLINHICHRLHRELLCDIAVVDIYIQKVTFILRADHPNLIRRRWLERIVKNQMPDGGWNDRWLCFTSGRRPAFNSVPPANQHATIQAITALYLARYRYPEHFGLKNSTDHKQDKNS